MSFEDDSYRGQLDMSFGRHLQVHIFGACLQSRAIELARRFEPTTKPCAVQQQSMHNKAFHTSVPLQLL